MAGVKGRSGGPRANSGGAREGAGRPPKEPEVLAVGSHEDSLDFLRAVMNEMTADAKLRVDAAKAILPYEHARKEAVSETGKKQQAADKAKSAAKGRYSAVPPPSMTQ